MSLLKASTVDFEKAWEEMQTPLASLLSGLPQSLPNAQWLAMYSSIYKICTNPGAPQAELLFFRLRGLLVTHVDALLEKLRRTDGEVEFLKAYCAAFEAFTTGASYISELFRYLLALHIWNDIAFATLKKRIARSVVGIYDTARRESADDANVCGLRRERRAEDDAERCVLTYYALGLCKHDPMSLYRAELDRPFVQHTLEYYSALGKELISKLSVSEYLKEVEQLCLKEQRRCEGILHRVTIADVRQMCCEVLVQAHAERICADAESFLVHNQTDDLHRLFVLFSELPTEHALTSFKNILKKFIEQRGLDVVRQFGHEDAAKNPESYIEALVQVHNEYFALIKQTFGFNALMRRALDQLPELLARYTHCLMSHDKRPGGTPHELHPAASGIPSTSLLAEESLEKKVETVGVVFCLIDDKDVFKKHYAKFLAKRLIKGTSIANDLEILLIQKLRDICGHDFVSKLQKMLKDKLLSKELLGAFAAWMEEKDTELRKEDAKHALAIQLHLSTAYHCDVLTAGAWPISSASAETQLLLPAPLEVHVALFTKFYTERSSGRKLLWVHQCASGTLQARCFAKRHEFALSFYQMLVLLLFNTATQLSHADLRRLTNIPPSDLSHHVASLVKAKILLASSDAENPSYALNFDFTSRKLRVSAVPSAPVEPAKAVKATSREVAEDRKMALQAAIVRVLKTRRDILLPQLEVDVVEMLRNQFAPSPEMIRQNVGILIDKEYLRRHESSEHRLVYVA
ncbi:hypothetical protein PybrP1_005013 [[Pythium] brassicae (nom. inval.)]|nr:hypothetical protein PybrP1_005013 [[Pythium] brassicae (nom. inval.)]